MMPLWLLGTLTAALIGFYTIDSDDKDVTAPGPIATGEDEASAMLAKIKEDETWDASYLLGCHAQQDAVKLHFCYETVSGETIQGFYEAFRHGNTLLSRYMENPDDLVLEAANLMVARGMHNYRELQETCNAGGCTKDVKAYVDDNKGFARALQKKADSLSTSDS